jgi:hypothetical protein
VNGGMLTIRQLLYTLRGRKWLETWCDRTPLRGDAAVWLKELKKARKEMPDDQCPKT